MFEPGDIVMLGSRWKLILMLEERSGGGSWVCRDVTGPCVLLVLGARRDPGQRCLMDDLCLLGPAGQLGWAFQSPGLMRLP